MGIISNFLNQCTILNTYDKQYLQKQKELRRNHEAILDTLRSNKEVKLTILREGKTIELNMTRGQDNKFGLALTRIRKYLTVNQYKDAMLVQGDQILKAVAIEDVDTEFLSTKKFLEESKRHTQQFESEYFKHQKSLNEKIEVLEMMLRSAGELTQDSPPEGPK